MGIFWDTLRDADAMTLDALGEEVTLGSTVVMGVVENIELSEGTAAGGRKKVVVAKVMVPLVDGLRDGMPVRLRGADGKVARWEPTNTGHAWLQIGSANRWSGEIPGV